MSQKLLFKIHSSGPPKREYVVIKRASLANTFKNWIEKIRLWQ